MKFHSFSIQRTLNTARCAWNRICAISHVRCCAQNEKFKPHWHPWELLLILQYIKKNHIFPISVWALRIEVGSSTKSNKFKFSFKMHYLQITPIMYIDRVPCGIRNLIFARKGFVFIAIRWMTGDNCSSFTNVMKIIRFCQVN